MAPAICSILDTDLYKLTMQSAVLRFFPRTDVKYGFTNRTPKMKFNRKSFEWLESEISDLRHLALTAEERAFLERKCPYLSTEYLDFLEGFRFKPEEQVSIQFQPDEENEDSGSIELFVHGLWKDTILFEIPLLALISESYFKFVETNWDLAGQLELARDKGNQLLEHGCIFSEFGSRRRRDYKTQDLVMQGLIQARDAAKEKNFPGTFRGSSNVHQALKYDVEPIGTMAHEWFMGIAAYTGDYENANLVGLDCWTKTFGEGVLAIALTDTFGTRSFLKAFETPVPEAASQVHRTDPGNVTRQKKIYADMYSGVRQDSGDPADYARMMRDFYDKHDIKEHKAMVFSDSLNLELCFKYKKIAEDLDLAPSFGIGTFLTNDFNDLTTGKHSTPLNIVIKLASAGGKPAVKISDNVGKNTGDAETVKKVKQLLGYEEKEWADGDEANRWDHSNTAK